MITYLLLALGLGLLAWGGDIMVDGAVCLARRLGVSTLLIGLTLVGFGTSSPELVSSIIAVFQGSDGIAVGNVVGSNIANILLVLGAAAVIAPVRVDKKQFHRDGTFLMGATILLMAAIFAGHVNRALAMVFVATLCVYLIYSYISDRRANTGAKSPDPETQNKNVAISTVKTIAGIALTILGARLLVDNAITLARDWGVSEATIGLTVVAIGTSLPELATSVASALKKHNDVAFGNVVGSNIYNALFIIGVTALLAPITLPAGMTIDAIIMTVVTMALVILALWRGGISRGTGALFLVLYAIYTAYIYQT